MQLAPAWCNSRRRTVARQIDQPERLVLQTAILEGARAAGAGAVEIDGLSSARSGAALGEESRRFAVLGGGDGQREGIEQG